LPNKNKGINIIDNELQNELLNVSETSTESNDNDEIVELRQNNMLSVMNKMKSEISSELMVNSDNIIIEQIPDIKEIVKQESAEIKEEQVKEDQVKEEQLEESKADEVAEEVNEENNYSLDQLNKMNIAAIKAIAKDRKITLSISGKPKNKENLINDILSK
jgi:hypothetical protein